MAVKLDDSAALQAAIGDVVRRACGSGSSSRRATVTFRTEIDNGLLFLLVGVMAPNLRLLRWLLPNGYVGMVDGLPWEAAFGGMVLTFLAFAAAFLFAGRRTFRRHDDPCELRCYRSGTNIIRESRIWRNP